MIEKQDEIIEKIDNLKQVKRMKELINIIKSDKRYKSLMTEFNQNKDKYVKENILNEQIIILRKKLFEIDELKEYLSIQNDIRLLSININNIIKSIIN